jgi:D-glycero-alpha-D-manno-heptose-7-phosphate kinase
MGSSSSFTVGLLHALHAFKGMHVGPQQLAEEACFVELRMLKEPIGKQDQYIAAFGGLRLTEFHADGRVTSTPVVMPQTRYQALEKCLMLFYTGVRRKAGDILGHQNADTAALGLDIHLDKIRDLADQLFGVLTSGDDLADIGEILNLNWDAKRRLVASISNDAIDQAYLSARRAGAIGGKLLGAGGGGFLLMYADPPNQPAVERALGNYKRVPFRIHMGGSAIVYTDV